MEICCNNEEFAYPVDASGDHESRGSARLEEILGYQHIGYRIWVQRQHVSGSEFKTRTPLNLQHPCEGSVPRYLLGPVACPIRKMVWNETLRYAMVGTFFCRRRGGKKPHKIRTRLSLKTFPSPDRYSSQPSWEPLGP